MSTNNEAQAGAVGSRDNALRDALESIERFGLDTLSGRTDGPDDREWQREAVKEMTRRAQAALAASSPTPGGREAWMPCKCLTVDQRRLCADRDKCSVIEAHSAPRAESRESQMVVVQRDESGVATVWCDPEVEDLVRALNNGGLRTVASCSGHGERPGNIALADGRELFIARDFDEGRRIDAALTPPAPQGAIPACVYYDVITDNFYEVSTRSGMGEAFYQKWRDRRSQFPGSAKAATPTQDAAHGGRG